jgi:hypothetical protein
MMKTLVEPREHSIWGDKVATENGWSSWKNWWYFCQPKNPGPELRDALESEQVRNSSSPKTFN